MQTFRKRGLTRSKNKDQKEKKNSEKKGRRVKSNERILKSIMENFDPFSTQIPPLVIETTTYLETHGM